MLNIALELTLKIVRKTANPHISHPFRAEWRTHFIFCNFSYLVLSSFFYCNNNTTRHELDAGVTPFFNDRNLHFESYAEQRGTEGTE